MINTIKEKVMGATGSVSGVASVFGSWQVCHNICLGLIAVLAVLGVTVTGMPLLFLTKWAIPLWTIAFVLLLITSYFYFKKKCISSKLMLFNLGVIIAGIPFQAVQRFSIYLWVVGGLLAFIAIIWFIRDKIQGRHKNG